jgi:hypothetical protein
MIRSRVLTSSFRHFLVKLMLVIDWIACKCSSKKEGEKTLGDVTTMTGERPQKNLGSIYTHMPSSLSCIFSVLNSVTPHSHNQKSKN